MKSGATDRKVFSWSMLIGVGVAVIAFLTSWLGRIHEAEPPTAYQLFDISFYYFTPLLSWALLTALAIRIVDHKLITGKQLKPILLKLIVVVFLLSLLVRSFDILVDYSIKNIVGMVNVSPLKILGDVWLVILFSSPTAMFKIAVIFVTVYLLRRRSSVKDTLTIRTSDGTYHVLNPETINYLLADGNYLNLHAANSQYKIRATLKSFESKLGSDFHRIHKSTIINWRNVKQLKHWRNGEYLIVMQDNKPLTSSKTYKESIDLIKAQMVSREQVADDPKLATVRPTIA
ncbi:MAG: LytTR family DNA-binding domain-containing protein [Ekhidna sp.]